MKSYIQDSSTHYYPEGIPIYIHGISYGVVDTSYQSFVRQWYKRKQIYIDQGFTIQNDRPVVIVPTVTTLLVMAAAIYITTVILDIESRYSEMGKFFLNRLLVVVIVP